MRDNCGVAKVSDSLHQQDRILVLGIGNLLWADEGFGVRAVEALNASWLFPPWVQLVDGGTRGLGLLPYVCEASRLLIFDAVDFNRAPGEVCVIHDDDVPRFFGAHKISMHQAGFHEVLLAARMLGEHPERLTLIGVQPMELEDYGGGLRPEVRKCLPRVTEIAVDVLASWGVYAGHRKCGAFAPDLSDTTTFSLV